MDGESSVRAGERLLPEWAAWFTDSAWVGLILIFAGWALWTARSWAYKLFILANGMLIIAVINAVSWYGDRGEMGFVLFFVALAVASVFFVMRAEE